jgi:hypothetical protein
MEAGKENALRFLVVILCGIAIILSLWALSEARRAQEESRSRLQVHLIEGQIMPESPGTTPASFRAAEEARELQRRVYEVVAYPLPAMTR